MQIKRFKGLGEMNAKQLFETTMDPDKPHSSSASASTRTTPSRPTRCSTILMGDVVEPRKQFIEDNALNVRNLDV